MFRKALIAGLTVLSVCSWQSSPAAEIGVEVVFSDQEISIISAWYREHGSGGSKHGNKSKGLPPGIAKNLQRGKPLPPGIAKQHLPHDLDGLLPHPPRGFERVIVDGRVLLVEVATRVIHDILTDVALH